MGERQTFLNVASIGLAAQITHTLTRRLKKIWGVLAYPLCLYDAYKSNRAFLAWITCDGRTRRVLSIQIGVGNGRHYGGGLTVRHDSRIDDHRLDLYSLEPQSIWELIKTAPSILNGAFRENQRVRLMEGQDIKIATSKPLCISTDGELTTWTPAHFKVKKAVLPVFIP